MAARGGATWLPNIGKRFNLVTDNLILEAVPPHCHCHAIGTIDY
jgi:hypothetical protein